MKRYYFSLILMVTIVVSVITSCEKDDSAVGMIVSGTLEFSERYNDEITKIQVDVLELENIGVPVFKRVTLASGEYSNGKFSLELPARIDDNYLKQNFSNENLEPYIKVSDKRVKTGIFDFRAIDFGETIKEGNGMGIYLSKDLPLVYIKSDDISTTKGLFFYADRNCSITGTEPVSSEHHTITYSMNLKRGWNIVYHTEKYMETADKQIRIEELSTETVSGLKWYVMGDF